MHHVLICVFCHRPGLIFPSKPLGRIVHGLLFTGTTFPQFGVYQSAMAVQACLWLRMTGMEMD